MAYLWHYVGPEGVESERGENNEYESLHEKGFSRSGYDLDEWRLRSR
jgi:hypothetical protein